MEASREVATSASRPHATHAGLLSRTMCPELPEEKSMGSGLGCRLAFSLRAWQGLRCHDASAVCMILGAALGRGRGVGAAEAELGHGHQAAGPFGEPELCTTILRCSVCSSGSYRPVQCLQQYRRMVVRLSSQTSQSTGWLLVLLRSGKLDTSQLVGYILRHT